MFLPTVKFAVDKSISDTFWLPSSAYNPLFSFKFILGTPNLNVGATDAPVGKAPLHIPVTLLTAARVKERPSDDTLTTLLNLSDASSVYWYLTIVSVFIPVKLLPAHVAIPAAFIFNLSVILKPVGTLLCRTVSATKSDAYPDMEDASW